jgi:hypothetical protein
MANKFSKDSVKHFMRIVKPYKRKFHGKTIQVEGYRQTYIMPRGPVKRLSADKLNKRSQTMWLMDRSGHFVGRANYEGKTAATGIHKWGYDQTKAIRDEKRYKRIFGRTPSPRSKAIRRG